MSIAWLSYKKDGKPDKVHGEVCMAGWTNPAKQKQKVKTYGLLNGAYPRFGVVLRSPIAEEHVPQLYAFRDAFNYASASGPKCSVYTFQGKNVVEMYGEFNTQQLLLFSYMARWWDEYTYYRDVAVNGSPQHVLAHMFHCAPRGWSPGKLFPLMGHHVSTCYGAPAVEEAPPEYTAEYWRDDAYKALLEWPMEAMRRAFQPSRRPFFQEVRNADLLKVSELPGTAMPDFGGPASADSATPSAACYFWDKDDGRLRYAVSPLIRKRYDIQYTAPMRLAGLRGAESSADISKQAWQEVLENA